MQETVSFSILLSPEASRCYVLCKYLAIAFPCLSRLFQAKRAKHRLTGYIWLSWLPFSKWFQPPNVVYHRVYSSRWRPSRSEASGPLFLDSPLHNRRLCPWISSTKPGGTTVYCGVGGGEKRGLSNFYDLEDSREIDLFTGYVIHRNNTHPFSISLFTWGNVNTGCMTGVGSAWERIGWEWIPRKAN